LLIKDSSFLLWIFIVQQGEDLGVLPQANYQLTTTEGVWEQVGNGLNYKFQVLLGAELGVTINAIFVVSQEVASDLGITLPASIYKVINWHYTINTSI